MIDVQFCGSSDPLWYSKSTVYAEFCEMDIRILDATLLCVLRFDPSVKGYLLDDKTIYQTVCGWVLSQPPGCRIHCSMGPCCSAVAR